VEVPPNTTATIRLPEAAGQLVTEGGINLRDVESVTSVAQEEGAVLLEVGSGRYEFVYDSPALQERVELGRGED
jgi:alpha-L-rhamnosidase